MQWTKVSNKYAELVFSDASDGVFRTYIRLMLLVSSMEFAPNLNQLFTKLGRRKVQTLIKYIEDKQKELGKDKISLDIIIDKVMEDVSSVESKRDGNRERQKNHRITRDITPLDKNKNKNKNKIREDKNTISQQNNILLDAFGPILKEKVLVYLDRVRLKNKSQVITEGRKNTLITELFNSKNRCADNPVFSHALDASISKDACCVGYVNKVWANKKTQRPM